MAESAVIGLRSTLLASARSTMTTWFWSLTFSRTQIKWSDSKVKVYFRSTPSGHLCFKVRARKVWCSMNFYFYFLLGSRSSSLTNWPTQMIWLRWLLVIYEIWRLKKLERLLRSTRKSVKRLRNRWMMAPAINLITGKNRSPRIPGRKNLPSVLAGLFRPLRMLLRYFDVFSRSGVRFHPEVSRNSKIFAVAVSVCVLCAELCR